MHAPVDFDQEADALYVHLSDAEVDRTTSLDDLRAIDYSSDGAVVGVEFVGVAGGVDLSDLPFAERIDRLIGESGHPIKILA